MQATRVGELWSFDHWVMDYFAERCAGIARGGSPGLVKAELFAVGEVLELACENHMESADDTEFHDIELDVAKHKAMLTAT